MFFSGVIIDDLMASIAGLTLSIWWVTEEVEERPKTPTADLCLGFSISCVELAALFVAMSFKWLCYRQRLFKLSSLTTDWEA